MTPLLYTTGWGLLYLAVLVALMTPCLFFANRRYLAGAMFLLFACDRMAVNLLQPDQALGFLSFAYILVTVAVVMTHAGRSAIVMGVALLVTSIAFIAGALGVIDWDATGTIQELCGLIAMLAVIFRREHGGRAHVLGDGPWVGHPRRGANRNLAAKRHDQSRH